MDVFEINALQIRLRSAKSLTAMTGTSGVRNTPAPWAKSLRGNRATGMSARMWPMSHM